MKYIPFAAGVAVFASIVMCICLPACGLVLPLAAAGAALVSVFCFLFRRRERWFRLAVISCSALVGAALILPRSLSAEASAREYGGRTAVCRAVLLSDPRQTSGGWWEYEARPVDGSFSRRFVLYTSTPLQAQVYDEIEGQFRFSAPEASRKTYYTGRDVALLASLEGSAEVVGHGSYPVSSFFRSLRQNVRLRLLRYTDDVGFGLGYAVLTGDTSGLSEAEYETLSSAGLLHLVAVSGMHVALLIGFLAPFVHRIRQRWLRALLPLGAMLLLWGIAGGTPSVTRAVIMSGMMSGQSLLYRGSLPLNRLGTAMLLLLFVSPQSALTLSFQLSFAACLGILLLAGPMFRWVSTGLFCRFGILPGPALRTALQGLVLSCGAFLATLPVLVLQLGEVSLTGIPSTLLCGPLAGGIFLLGLCTVLTGGLPLLPTVFGWGIDRCCGMLYRVARATASLPFRKEGVLGDVRMLFLGGLLLAAVLVLFRKFPKNRAKRILHVGRRAALLFLCVLILSSACLAGTFLASDADRAEDSVITAFLDVGQGNCFVTVRQDRAFVVDCGGTKSPGQTAVEYLTDHGVTTIDFVLLSHLHDDHTNGIAAVIAAFPVGELIIPAAEGDAAVYVQIAVLAVQYDVPLTVLSEDSSRPFGRGGVTFLTGHLDPAAEDQNENSVVALLEYGSFRVLFTGDITAQAEARLREVYGTALKCDVLSVPHHGSAYSSSFSFLAVTRPSLAVVSVGGNTYGQPSDGTLSRLGNYCGTVLRTDVGGSVEIRTDGTKAEVYQG